MRPWNFFAGVPTETRLRSSLRAARLPGDSAMKLLREISASILASLLRWPISPSAVGKKVSSASFTGRGATPSNFSLSQRSSSSAGRVRKRANSEARAVRSEEHTSELQSRSDLVCRLLLEKKKNKRTKHDS